MQDKMTTQQYLDATPQPKEDVEQTWLFRWAKMESGTRPELKMMYHIPNGGSRNKIEAAKLKAQGVKAGVPDICLPVPRGGCHGLYIELKRIKGGRLSPEQVSWMGALKEQGYMVAVCQGWELARDVITQYLKGAAGEQAQI